MTSPATTLPSITRDEFGAFFAALNGGHRPFSWQEEVLDHICEHGVWPERINAPTGSGKSSVVDIHLFANALAAVGAAPRVPRRLCVTVGRRALVDSHADRAREKILDCMGKALANESDESDILRRVAEALQSFQTRNDEKGSKPFETGHIRGELSNRNLPVTDISACAIIAATPDMYGSRALFRGYGSTKAARPRETALLTMDTVMVLDEAHMNRQLLHTTQRIAELQKYEADLGVPTLQVVETTATPSTEDSESTTLGVDIEALDTPNDKELHRRVYSHKELVLHPIDKWDGKPGNSPTVNAAVDAIMERLAHREAGESSKKAYTVGCIVNHVRTAISIKEALAKNKALGKDEVQLLVGRMRPYDLKNLQAEHSGLFTTEGDESVKVVVATQTLEVGIDVDFADLVTELAPASSLAQRFGRVNRLGHRTDSKVVVIEPASSDLVKKDAPPYKAVDLSNAYAWLEALNGAENPSVNPAAMVKNPPVQSSPERLLYQRPEWPDLLEFSRTDENPYDEPDLDLWLHDSLDAETAMGGVIVRDNLPSNTSAAMEILKTSYFAPSNRETFPANLKILQEILDYQDEHGVKPRKFLYRQGEISLWQDADHGAESSQSLAPGDVLLLDMGSVPFTNQGIAVTQRELPSKKDELKAVPFLDDAELYVAELYVYEKCADREKHFREYLGLSPEEAAELLDSQSTDGKKMIASELSTEAEGGQEVIAWYAEVTGKESVEGSDIAQELVLAAPVLLDDHQNDVAERTRQLAENLGLAPEFSEALELAAKYHDEGKRDLRFQQMLGADPDAEALAKSGHRSVAEAYRARSRSALPRGWRHEQLSALMVAASPEKVGEHRDLVLRIIGCSHGHGRFSFAHDAGFLLKEGYLPEGTDYEALKEQATRLFNVGYWDNLMEQTSRTYGPYATAYLEAVERAADAQISREGH